MDQSKIDSFQERLFTELNAGMSCMALYIGKQLGLFEAISKTSGITSTELATQTELNERYVREWVECMAAGEYIEYDGASERFSLSQEHKVVLLDLDSPSYAMGIFGWIPSFASVLPRLMEAFRTGDGIPYEDYGQDMVDAQGLSTRPMFVNDYASMWIPAMPDIEARLKNGGRVAEVGCGIGWSTIAVAKGYPNTKIDAIDPDEVSMADAKQNFAQEGVADQITLYVNTVEEAPVQGPYDLVTAFECLHDLPYPVSALSRMRELAAPNGAVLIADEAVEDKLEDNTNFMGHMFYNFSVLHCLPQAMGFEDTAATGTVITPSTVRKYAEEAGFSSVDQLEIENGQFKFYRLNP